MRTLMVPIRQVIWWPIITQPLEHFPTGLIRFDGSGSVFRADAVRSAMPTHRASAATNSEDRSAPPKAGCFCAVTALRFFADGIASPCEARLATTQNHPGQMVQSGRKVL
jgi:hypothetical protein